jgi:tetratricopeptide (TPR) repeat protein
LKHYGQAEAAFKEALAQDPTYTYGKVHYARFLFERNRIKDAKVVVQEATSEDPENASLALLRGEIALIDGDTTEAIGNALWILGRHADSYEALWLLVRAKARRHPILGLLWRFVLWAGHLKSYQQTLIVIVLFYVGVFSGLLVVWIAFLAVYLVSLYLMKRMVRRELQSVRVKPF